MIFTYEFPYILHCSYLMLAKHFEVLLWRLLDLKCITAHFYKLQKYKVLFWQTEYLEILDLLKTIASLASKSILAIMSVGQISACVIITAGWVLNRSALPVKSNLLVAQISCSSSLSGFMNSSLSLRKVLLLLMLWIKLIQAWELIMCPSTLGKLCS